MANTTDLRSERKNVSDTHISSDERSEQLSAKERLAFCLEKVQRRETRNLTKSVRLRKARSLYDPGSPSDLQQLRAEFHSWQADDEKISAAQSSGHGRGGGRIKEYIHALTDEQTGRLTDLGKERLIQEIKRKTGAEVELKPDPSPVPGMKIVIIRGVPFQIEEAVKLISDMTGAQGALSAQAEAFWLQWVKDAFPDLQSRAYFLPPVYVNRVPVTRESIGGHDVLVLYSAPGQANQPNKPVTILSPAFIQDSDLRDDAAFQRVLFCLQNMSEQYEEIFVGMSQLQFGQYLGEPCYAAAAAQLFLPKSLPSKLPQNWKQGDFDVLLIHRHYGFVVCEVKAFGDNVKQQDSEKIIQKKLRDAVSQLDKAEAMLSHLVSDIAPGLRITKTIAFPNLTARQLQQAISSDSLLAEDLCRCLGTTDPTDIAGVCLCSDQLPDPKTPWDVSSHVMNEFRDWWQRRLAGAGHDSHMTYSVYQKLVARFCGPATTVSVPCTSPPRLSIKTLSQAVAATGECYTAVITLFPEQLHLLHTQPPTLFVTGPPGTGKTVVLLLMAIQWLRCGHHVYVVSTWRGSRAACTMLYHLLLQTVNTQQSAGVSPGQPHLMQYNFEVEKDEKVANDLCEDVEKAVNELTQAAVGGSLYVIADEVGSTFSSEVGPFRSFYHELLTQIPHLHFWAASCYPGHAPAEWHVEHLTRSLRSPPAVVREVEQDVEFIVNDVPPYSDRGVPNHTDGPPVKRLYHRGDNHSGDWPRDCIRCGQEVARFLNSLRVGIPENVRITSTSTTSTRSSSPPCLHWRDVLVLSWGCVSDNSGMVKGMEEADIPVRVMKDEDIEDVAIARSDVVWVADGHRVQGLERKVVICIGFDLNISIRYIRLHFMSRCTSQLVIISPDP